MEWTLRGRAWKFGETLGLDADILPMHSVPGGRSTNGHVLKQYIMTGPKGDPDFPKKCKPGDIIVAGKRFGQGNPHVYGFIGIHAADLGIIAESVTRNAYRLMVAAPVRAIPFAPGITERVNTGDELEVNFESGLVRNLTTGEEMRYEPYPKFLRDIIEAGGMKAALAKQLAAARGRT